MILYAMCRCSKRPEKQQWVEAEQDFVKQMSFCYGAPDCPLDWQKYPAAELVGECNVKGAVTPFFSSPGWAVMVPYNQWVIPCLFLFIWCLITRGQFPFKEPRFPKATLKRNCNSINLIQAEVWFNIFILVWVWIHYYIHCSSRVNTSEAATKWPPFCRRQRQIAWYFDRNFSVFHMDPVDG